MATQNKNWEGKTGGGKLGQNFLLWFLKTVNVRFLYPVLYFVIPFYLLFGTKGRNASYSYFRKRHGYSKIKSAWSAFINHIIFGEVVLDKFALLAGNKDQFTIEQYKTDIIQKKLKEEKGFIIAGAHMGNLELSGLCIPHSQKRINAIIFGGERAEFQKQRDNAFGEVNINMIPVTNDMSHLFAIKEALDNGEVVVIPCDRLFGSNKNINCQLLNGNAQIPVGPFRLAAQLGVPVLTLFIMKENATHYKAYENEIVLDTEYPNSTQAANEMAKQFSGILEEMMKRYPTQWFNFFPYWNDKATNK